MKNIPENWTFEDKKVAHGFDMVSNAIGQIGNHYTPEKMSI